MAELAGIYHHVGAKVAIGLLTNRKRVAVLQFKKSSPSDEGRQRQAALLAFLLLVNRNMYFWQMKM